MHPHRKRRDAVHAGGTRSVPRNHTQGSEVVETANIAPTDKASQVAFVHQIWSAHPAQLAPIRAEVRRWLAPLGLSEDTDVGIVIAVNEAAANAIEHAPPHDTVELTFWTEDTALSVEVVDHGRWQPPSSAELTGRHHGIPMMHRCVDSVLIHYDTRGTRVLLRHPRPQPAD